MADQRTDGQAAGLNAGDELYRLALRLGALLDPDESMQGALEACAALVAAGSGMLICEGLPAAALAVPRPTLEAASAALAAPAVRAAADLLGVSALPPGVVPLPGKALLAAAIPGAAGAQGVLLLARDDLPAFPRQARTLLAAALPLVGQTLDRARRGQAHPAGGTLRDSAVSHLAHDLRSPLVSTRASLEVVQSLLKGQPVPPPVFEALRTGLRSVQAAVELCSDLLEVSRLQNGFRIVARPVPLDRLLHDTCLMMQPVAAQRSVALMVGALSPALRTSGDERLLRRMLTNLVANGLRFAPAGGFVELDVLPDGQAGVLLRVSDNGPGIPPAERERVFLPFAQGLGESARGTGLGLTLCREVAEAHGGQIWVEARPEGGAMVVVRLPAA